jgi:membrane protein DedA with SNARE-associated domain
LLSHFTWVALFAVLVLAGMGLPIPEDVPLILSGYMSNPKFSPINQIPSMVDADRDGVAETMGYKQVPPNLLYWMIIAGLAGVIIGDAVVFTIGRHGIEGNGFVARHLRKVMHSKRREKVERHFAKHGNLTVFLGRFLFPVRSLTFAMAGLSKMSYTRFLLIDGCAAAISVPTFILLGYGFAEEIDKVFAWIDRAKRVLWPVAVAILVAVVAIYLVRRRRRPAALENA